MDKKHCCGCRNNFYNGNNDLGVRECWSFGDAKIIWRKEVHYDQRPPWDQKAIRKPNCYHKERYVYVKPYQTR